MDSIVLLSYPFLLAISMMYIFSLQKFSGERGIVKNQWIIECWQKSQPLWKEVLEIVRLVFDGFRQMLNQRCSLERITIKSKNGSLRFSYIFWVNVIFRCISLMVFNMLLILFCFKMSSIYLSHVFDRTYLCSIFCCIHDMKVSLNNGDNGYPIATPEVALKNLPLAFQVVKSIKNNEINLTICRRA